MIYLIKTLLINKVVIELPHRKLIYFFKINFSFCLYFSIGYRDIGFFRYYHKANNVYIYTKIFYFHVAPYIFQLILNI
jgi:hypothetical protein